MRLIGLTGGIGSGKSSASARLALRGAVIIDADAIVRELQQPGQPVFDQMVERWGDRIVAEDGALDRAAVAGIVFGDSDELAAIEKMIHPEVRKETERRIEQARLDDGVVVIDNPLLVESVKKAREAKARGEKPESSGGSSPTPQAIIVVECPTETAIDRLIAHRGFDRADAEARMAAQVDASERLAIADFVIDNGGDEAQLDAEIERCWSWIQTLEPLGAPEA